jgi:hypothetical protein
VADALALASEALDALAAETIDDHHLGDELVALYALIDRLQAQASRRLAVFDGRGDGAADGFKSTVAWLVGRCRKHPADAARAVRTARLERHVPDITDLWEAGATTAAHVDYVARLRHRAKADAIFDALADTWTDLCRDADLDTMSKAGTAFLDRLDNTKPVTEQDKAEAINRRMLAGSLCLGVGNIEARCDAQDFDIVIRAVEQERRAGHAEGDERTLEQERLDGLVEICRRTLTGANDGGEAEPYVGVVVTDETLAGREAGLCETDTGLALSVETVRRMCCHSVIGRIVVDQKGVVLNLGAGARLFNRAQRRAMAFRDRGCCFPACKRPARHCEAHHLHWWEHGGPTDLENGALLCYAHHRLVHELGWQVRRNGSGGLDWFKPDGRHHATWHPPGIPEPLPMSPCGRATTPTRRSRDVRRW